MNIIFLTMSRLSDINVRGIYADLMRIFKNEGHTVYIVTPNERSKGKPTEMVEKDLVHILSVRTLNLQKTNAIEKGIGQLLVEPQYKSAIKKYFKDIHFDIILYSTPPITFPRVIKYLRKRDPEAKTYLLLKDIFPQNAIDLGMLSKTGIKGLIYKYFRHKEKTIYRLSDHIGCMSPANVRYLLDHNREISPSKVEVAPNSIELRPNIPLDRDSILAKYGMPIDHPIFIYGGNLGRPQGIPFIIKCLAANSSRTDCHFVVIGNGTEYHKVKDWYDSSAPSSVTVLEGIPKEEYDELVGACSVGLIFLDHRFTIPNFPSRLLSYLENKMPVLCSTDPNTDIGTIAQENGFGYWCESNSVEAFNTILEKMLHSDMKAMGEKGYVFLKDNYLVEHTYNVIMSHV